MNKIMGALFIALILGAITFLLLIHKTEAGAEQELFVLTEDFVHLSHNIYVDGAGDYFATVGSYSGVTYIEKVKPMVFETMMKYDVSYHDAKQMVYN